MKDLRSYFLAPGPVDLKYVMKSDSQPTDLQVMFERTDEDKDNPQHGRPTVFVIRWTKITEKQKQACDSCTVPWIDGMLQVYGPHFVWLSVQIGGQVGGNSHVCNAYFVWHVCWWWCLVCSAKSSMF